MKFTKMHGCGNDYVYINGFSEKINKEDKPEFVKKVSDRHFGIGSDGVIFINPSDIADFEMEMFNADGTRAEMCGNGIRSVAKYVYDRHLTDKEEMTIESMGKVKYITVFPENGKAKLIKVDMGEPILKASDIPVVSNEEKVIDEIIFVDDKEYRMTCVSMGNPHAVVLLDPDTLKIEEIGPKFENHVRFPERINTEFIKIIDRKNVKMRVWERGTGETLACGTGCCATTVACILNNLTDDEIIVHVRGGDINVKWDKETNHVFMTGPAEFVFDGEIEY
ncbi:MAG: diaminopimelate epimerase [Lachnospiraceae bacterium]|nr:diaminopimelate epimerase [Lachnospiraceae bacterium]